MDIQMLFKPVIILICYICTFNALSQTEKDWVDGDLIEFIKDGAWCWFQDERAVVDTSKEKLIIGSANMQASVDVSIYNISTKKVESKKTFARLQYTDDHNSPALLVGPDGNYIAMWAHHYDKYNSHYSIYNDQQWSPEMNFDWNKIPGGTNYTIAYSNLYYLSNENRIYNFARANERAPNFIYSDDNGKTWKFGGQLTTNNSSSYNKGYYKYWGNGVDRIDMVFTEQHPRDFTTSIYHGYLTNGKTYSTDGKVADEDIYEKQNIPTFGAFTKVFEHGTKVNGITMGRCWQSDLMRFNDGTIAILFEARANNSETDHRNFYARYDGDKWKITYIGKAGTKMYESEQDYTGLGALCPDDPNRIYISSPFNPGNDESIAKKREIWRGTTTNNGETWKWEPVTANSSVDNFRPIVPMWKPGKEALLWFRGTYQSAQIFSLNVVGTIYNYQVGTSNRINRRNYLNSAISIVPSLPNSGLITLQCTIPQKSTVTLQIFSTSGKMVKKLTHRIAANGVNLVHINAENLPGGVYFCRLSTGTLSKVVPLSIVY